MRFRPLSEVEAKAAGGLFCEEASPPFEVVNAAFSVRVTGHAEHHYRHLRRAELAVGEVMDRLRDFRRILDAGFRDAALLRLRAGWETTPEGNPVRLKLRRMAGFTSRAISRFALRSLGPFLLRGERQPRLLQSCHRCWVWASRDPHWQWTAVD